MSVAGNYIKFNFPSVGTFNLPMKTDGFTYTPRSVKVSITKSMDGSGNLLQFVHADAEGSDEAGFECKADESIKLMNYLNTIEKTREIGTVIHYIHGMSKEITQSCMLVKKPQRMGVGRQITINFVEIYEG